MSYVAIMVEDRRIELLTQACKARVFPLALIPHRINWHPLKDSNLGMSESKSDALDQLGEEGKIWYSVWVLLPSQ